jgi:hypothetical protein
VTASLIPRSSEIGALVDQMKKLAVLAAGLVVLFAGVSVRARWTIWMFWEIWKVRVRPALFEAELLRWARGMLRGFGVHFPSARSLKPSTVQRSATICNNSLHLS